MKEKVKVSYKGTILEAIRNEDGTYRLDLPSEGSVKSFISNLEDGWRIYEYDEEYIADSYSWIKIRNDGTVEYASDMTHKVKILETDYNPNLSDLGYLDEVVRDLYDVSQQLEGYEKLGISPVDVIELRTDIMRLSLEMLGYKDIQDVFHGEPNPDSSIMDLEHAIKYLERYPALAQYVSKDKGRKLESVKVDVPSDISRDDFKNLFEEAQSDYNDEKAYLTDRKYEIDRRRDELILPDFCKGLKKKLDFDRTVRKNGNLVTQNDWEDYVETTRNLAKLVLGFNADLLSAQERNNVVQGTSLNQVELLHQVSLITEPKEIDTVLDVESRFFIEEARRLYEKAQTDSNADQYTQNSSVGKLIKELAAETLGEAIKRTQSIKDRDYYRNIYPFDSSRKKTLKRAEDDYGSR